MSEIAFAIRKLDDLITLAVDAETDFEKAAVFGAASALLAFVEAEAEEKFTQALENVERLRGSLGAIVGYELTNNHDSARHASWARAAVIALQGYMCE